MFNLDLLFVRMYSELDPLSNIVRIMDKNSCIEKGLQVYTNESINQVL